MKLNLEALATFSGPELSGRVRLGVPDDYADRYLPEIMARFSRAYPGVELSVICEPSVDLLDRIDSSELDLAIVTNCEARRVAETFRRERLLWVTSNRHATHTEDPLPLALLGSAVRPPGDRARQWPGRRRVCGCPTSAQGADVTGGLDVVEIVYSGVLSFA